MLQAILELFTTTQKAEAMLDIPIIKTIFIILFSLFIITCLTHMITFFKIKSIRNYVKQTKRLDINSLHSIKSEFESRQHTETITLATFIQVNFSEWRILIIPDVILL